MFSWLVAETPFVSLTLAPDSSAVPIGRRMDGSSLSGVVMTAAEAFSLFLLSEEQSVNSLKSYARSAMLDTRDGRLTETPSYSPTDVRQLVQEPSCFFL